MGAGEHKRVFGNSIDCTEQGLLNSYFDGVARPEFNTRVIWVSPDDGYRVAP